jgi:ribonuclease P protein component
MRDSFSKRNRLLSSKHYQSVFNDPRKFFSECFVILVIPNHLNYSRLGILIKKKNIKHAVNRNSMKRVVRESFRTHPSIILAGLDLVVVVHKLLSKKQLVIHLDSQWKNILRFYKKS